jgi:hypothetical protein
MPKSPLPLIYCDVHIKQGALEAFTELGFKYIRIPQSKYRGIDEKDFIGNLYAENALFATGDVEFTKWVREQNIKHAGILEIHPDFDNEEAKWTADGVAKIAKVLIRQRGKHALRRHIIYLDIDGFRVFDDKGDDNLFYSWELMEQDSGS